MATENTHFGAKRISQMLEGVGSVYFIGIGGINMSSLAHITKLRGYAVGGSDRSETKLTRSLCSCGIHINYNHNKENISDYDAVVYTVAISPDNPEYLEAKRRGIPCISRADYLGYIMTGYRRRIGVAGMHGKSTCTSMCAQVYIGAHTDPTVLSGAELSIMDGAYRTGNGDDFIFEACEYMDSFLDFNPTVAIILNVEMDHVDYFHSIEQVKRSYAAYAALTGKDGYAVVNGDDTIAMDALRDYGGTLVTFGINDEGCLYRAQNIKMKNGCYCYDLIKGKELMCSVELSVPGYHNIYNSLACAAAADICGISPEDISSGLHLFSGAARRMELRGYLDGAAVYDDYGHHPTEVVTTLGGARALSDARDGRLFCVFQPHTYSRTKEFLDEFSRAFDDAHRVMLVDIYPARETDTLGVSSELLASLIGDKASYCPSFAAAAKMLSDEVSACDTVVVMGAGDIWHVFESLGERLK